MRPLISAWLRHHGLPGWLAPTYFTLVVGCAVILIIAAWGMIYGKAKGVKLLMPPWIETLRARLHEEGLGLPLEVSPFATATPQEAPDGARCL